MLLAHISHTSSEHHSVILVRTCPEVQRKCQVLLCQWRRLLLHRGHQPALLQVSDRWGWAWGLEQGERGQKWREDSKKSGLPDTEKWSPRGIDREVLSAFWK